MATTWHLETSESESCKLGHGNTHVNQPIFSSSSAVTTHKTNPKSHMVVLCAADRNETCRCIESYDYIFFFDLNRSTCSCASVLSRHWITQRNHFNQQVYSEWKRPGTCVSHLDGSLNALVKRHSRLVSQQSLCLRARPKT